MKSCVRPTDFPPHQKPTKTESTDLFPQVFLPKDYSKMNFNDPFGSTLERTESDRPSCPRCGRIASEVFFYAGPHEIGTAVTHDRKQDDSDVRSVDTATTSSRKDGIMTPTSSCPEKGPGTDYTPSVPRPGKSYKIHLKDTDKVIMVVEGKVVVQSTAEAKFGGGWSWACVEEGNWLGFRNHVTGKFLGNSEKTAAIHAQSALHSVNDRFCARQHPDGGYLLLVKHVPTGAMSQVRFDRGKDTLVRRPKDGDLWFFEEL